MARTATKRPNPQRSSAVRRAKAASANTKAAGASNGSSRAKAAGASNGSGRTKSAGAGNGSRRAKGAAPAKKPIAQAAKKSSARSAKKPIAQGAKKPVARAAKRPIEGAAKKAAKKALKALALKTARAGAGALRSAAERGVELGRSTVQSGLARRLPIQVSIDVAVPPEVAWNEWMTLESLTEGVRRIEDIERDGNQLRGRTAGPRPTDWTAEIVDEREQQSLAWRSLEATDCAGLVTFHQLSERLTRIELDLDVLPTGPAEAILLSSHLAQRRAQSELRRFKARVEFINPDVYEAEAGRNGDASDSNGIE